MFIIIVVILCSVLILGKYWLIGVGLGTAFSIYIIVSDIVKRNKAEKERKDKEEAFKLIDKGIQLPEKYRKEEETRLERERLRRESTQI